MNQSTSLLPVVREFLAKYPKPFVFLFFILLFEGAVSALSIIAVVPLADFLLDAELKIPSRITKTVLSVLEDNNILPSFWLFGILFVGLNLAKGILLTVVRYAVLKIKYFVVKDLISDALQKFFKARWSFFSGMDQGKIINTFNKEVINVGDTLGHLVSLLALLFQFTPYLIIPLMVNTSMTITALILFIFFSSPFLLIQRYSYHLGKRKTKAFNTAVRILNESLLAARIILGYGQQKKTIDNYIKALDQTFHLSLIWEVIITGIANLFRPMGLLASIIALGIAIQQGEKIPELTAVLWSLIACVPLVTQFLQLNNSIRNFLPSYEQIVSLRDQASLYEEIEGQKIFHKIKKGIELKNVSFTYPERRETLKDINLVIQKDKITALVGESGSGKSTITDLVLGLHIPNQGKVLLNGLSLNHWNQVSFRECVGYVPQEPILFHTSIRENLLWAYEKATENDLWDACYLANIDSFIKELPHGIDTIVGDRGVRLSGGQKQRIALARALLRKPELLILDEATSSLDSESERLIQQSIERVAHTTTILIIAHRLSTITNADMVYVIEGGTIVEKGTYDELYQLEGILTKMISSQQQPQFTS